MDVSTLYNKYEFIGDEFLSWLLFMIENHKDYLEEVNDENTSLEVGSRIVLKNVKGNVNKTVTIKSNYAGLEESMIFLRKGALVSEINLIYTSNDKDWTFTLKGKDLSFVSLKLPVNIETKKDLEYFFLEKVDLCDKVSSLLDGLFESFVKIRVSTEWSNKTVTSMRSWMNGD